MPLQHTQGPDCAACIAVTQAAEAMLQANVNTASLLKATNHAWAQLDELDLAKAFLIGAVLYARKLGMAGKLMEYAIPHVNKILDDETEDLEGAAEARRTNSLS